MPLRERAITALMIEGKSGSAMARTLKKRTCARNHGLYDESHMRNISIGFKVRPRDAAQLVRFAQALGLRAARAWRPGHEVVFVEGPTISTVTEFMKRFCLSYDRLLSRLQPDGTYRIVDTCPRASKGHFLNMAERKRRWV